MPTMTRIASVTRAKRTIRDEMIAARHGGSIANQIAHILRRDGNTDTVRMDGRTGRVTLTRTVGHTTLGMQVDPTDLPCVIA